MNALIVDDSRLARQELKHLLKAFEAITVAGEAANADTARQQLKRLSVDVIFLDIQMPGQDGFELLETLDQVPQVIFTTAYDEYAIRAFEVNALDYLLKPIQPERLASAIEKLQAQTLSPDEAVAPVLTDSSRVFVKDGDQCWFITLSDIQLFEVSGNYTRVYFQKFKPLIPRTLNHLEERLDKRIFFRVNRQQIINLQYIEKIEPYFQGSLKVLLKGGYEIEISRRQTQKFRERLSL